MDQSSILSRFDGFVQSGVVLYDNQQQIVEHVDGKLKVSWKYSLIPLGKTSIPALLNLGLSLQGY